MRCEVSGLKHSKDSPPCDPETCRYGNLVTNSSGRILRYEPPEKFSSECRSLNANDAEIEGRLPLTRAIPAVAHYAGCTRKEARTALRKTHEGEWHHTGMLGRAANYYDVAEAIRSLRNQNG
jgi:hypothetical protein